MVAAWDVMYTSILNNLCCMSRVGKQAAKIDVI